MHVQSVEKLKFVITEARDYIDSTVFQGLLNGTPIFLSQVIYNYGDILSVNSSGFISAEDFSFFLPM